MTTESASKSLRAIRRSSPLLLTPAISVARQPARVPTQAFVVDGDERAAAFPADGANAPSKKEF